MFNIKTPCKKCPFRKDVPGYLTKERVRELHNELVEKDNYFICHETKDFVPNKHQHCAGALIILEKKEWPNQAMRMGERIGLYDRHELKGKDLVFETFREMEDHMP